MAATLVQIRGTLYDLQARTSRQVLLQGEASLMGLEVGGGPIIPGGGGGDGGLGIWGPTDPRPTPPIHLPPGGGGSPPGYWGPNDPRPTPPIHIPPEGPPGGGAPPPEGGSKPPPADGGWGYPAEFNQWGYFPGPTEAQPKG